MTHKASVIFYSLSDYNNGDLVPKEFDLNSYDNRQELESDVAGWLKEISTDDHLREEWILADFDGIPSGCAWEYGIHDSAFVFLKAVEKHGYEVAEAAYELGIINSFTANIEDRYIGTFDSVGDFVAEMLEESGQIEDVPEWLRGYIDYDALGRDWMIDTYTAYNDHYFRSA